MAFAIIFNTIWPVFQLRQLLVSVDIIFIRCLCQKQETNSRKKAVIGNLKPSFFRFSQDLAAHVSPTNFSGEDEKVICPEVKSPPWEAEAAALLLRTDYGWKKGENKAH